MSTTMPVVVNPTTTMPYSVIVSPPSDESAEILFTVTAGIAGPGHPYVGPAGADVTVQLGLDRTEAEVMAVALRSGDGGLKVAKHFRDQAYVTVGEGSSSPGPSEGNVCVEIARNGLELRLVAPVAALEPVAVALEQIAQAADDDAVRDERIARETDS